MFRSNKAAKGLAIAQAPEVPAEGASVEDGAGLFAKALHFEKIIEAGLDQETLRRKREAEEAKLDPETRRLVVEARRARVAEILREARKAGQSPRLQALARQQIEDARASREALGDEKQCPLPKPQRVWWGRRLTQNFTAQAAKKPALRLVGKFTMASAAGALSANVFWVAAVGGLGATFGEAVGDYREQLANDQAPREKGFWSGLKRFFGFVGQNKATYVKKWLLNSGIGLLGAGIGAGAREVWDGGGKDFFTSVYDITREHFGSFKDHIGSLMNYIGLGGVFNPAPPVAVVDVVDVVSASVSEPVVVVEVPPAVDADDLKQALAQLEALQEATSLENAKLGKINADLAEAQQALELAETEVKEAAARVAELATDTVDLDYVPTLDSVAALNHLEEVAAISGDADLQYWTKEAWNGDDNPIAWKHLADYSARHGDYVSAHALIDQALAYDPDLPEAQKFSTDLLKIPGARAAIENAKASVHTEAMVAPAALSLSPA